MSSSESYNSTFLINLLRNMASVSGGTAFTGTRYGKRGPYVPDSIDIVKAGSSLIVSHAVIAPDSSVDALMEAIARVKQFAFPASDLTLYAAKTSGYQLRLIHKDVLKMMTGEVT